MITLEKIPGLPELVLNQYKKTFYPVESATRGC